MSNYSSIGIKINSEEEYGSILSKVIGSGKIFKERNYKYFLYRDTSGAELWVLADYHVFPYFYPDDLYESNWFRVHELNPHYNGLIWRKVKITEKIERPTERFYVDNAFKCWSVPENKDDRNYVEHPFVFDLPNALAIREFELPLYCRVQLAAFAHRISLFKSIDDFDLNNKTKVKWAHTSFVPVGLFKPNGTPADEPEAMAMITGIIKRIEKKKNRYSQNEFYHFIIETLGGELDIVAAPKLLTDEPKINGVMSGLFWLSGKLEDQYVKRD